MVQEKDGTRVQARVRDLVQVGALAIAIVGAMVLVMAGARTLVLAQARDLEMVRVGYWNLEKDKMNYGDWIGDENSKLKKEIADNFKVWEEAAKKAEAVLCEEIDSLREAVKVAEKWIREGLCWGRHDDGNYMCSDCVERRKILDIIREALGEEGK